MDLISVGRCMVDLYCDQVGSPLREAQSVSMYIGGCPTNVAVGAARLGLKVAMLTRVGDDRTGEFVRETFRREGVDVSHVVSDPTSHTPMVLAEIVPPDKFALTWYRERAADLKLQESDFDRAWLRQAKAVLISGNSYSTESSARVTRTLVEEARAAGCKIVYDIDYRPVLWYDEKPDGTRTLVEPARLREILPQVDLLVGTEEEYAALGGYEDARQLAPRAVTVRKLGPRGAQVARPGEGPVEVAGFPVKVLNTLGAGDAFMAGFLSGWLRDQTLEECVRRGNANGALVVTRHGCAPAMPYADEVAHFMQHGLDDTVERLHAAGSLPVQPALPLAILAIDHRTWFTRHTQDDDRVAAFKLKACQAVAERHRRKRWPIELGFILDREECLRWADDQGFWTAQCLEEANSTPLRLMGGDAALTLRSRPRRRGVKLLVTWDGDNPGDQLATLDQARVACRALGRPWILEVLRPDGGRDLTREMTQLRALSPDYWKVPIPDEVSPLLTSVVTEDPCCRGVLWLGGGQPLSELLPRLTELARLPISRGFAVGRTVFEQPFLDDQPEAVADLFEQLVQAWGL